MSRKSLNLASTFAVRECVNEKCGLRIPVLDNQLRGSRCPRCGSQVQVMATGSLDQDAPIPWSAAMPCEFHVLVDNIRSTFNVGSILRIADGAGVNHVHLCGITPTPENRKVGKTALGAEKSVAWSYYSNALAAAEAFIAQGVSLWALENVKGSTPLSDCNLRQAGASVALIVGNEIIGIDPELLPLCSRVLHIPMQGVKGSLNVAVAFGIAAYWLRGQA